MSAGKGMPGRALEAALVLLLAAWLIDRALHLIQPEVVPILLLIVILLANARLRHR
jgi:hypothetical protein